MEPKLGYHAKSKEAMDRLMDCGRENKEWAEDWDKGDTKRVKDGAQFQKMSAFREG